MDVWPLAMESEILIIVKYFLFCIERLIPAWINC